MLFPKYPDLARDSPTQLVVIGLLFTSQNNFAQVVNIRHLNTLNYGHELWVVTGRTRLRIQAAEIWASSAGCLGSPLEIG